MTDALYQQAILDHAKAAVGAGKLESPQGRATVDNPLCGDRVTIELTLDGARISAVAQHVRGCLLCQATASVIARQGVGRSPAELRTVRGDFRAMIKEDAEVPAGWPDLAAFQPVRREKSRHDCVLLPFEALDRALTAAGV